MEARHYFNSTGTAGTDIASTGSRNAAKRALEVAQKLDPNSPKTLLALGYYQHWVLQDHGSAKTTFVRVSKMLPGSSDVAYARGIIARTQGDWDQAIAYLEQALAHDPRNGDLLLRVAFNYMMLRQFPAAVKLYERALAPNDLDLVGFKAAIYQAQGNLEEAARLLTQISAQTLAFNKICQLRLERKYGEAVDSCKRNQAGSAPRQHSLCEGQ